jgi:hypothetical protein
VLRRPILVLVAVLVALAGTGCADSTLTPALRVGDRTLSERDVLDEIEEWAGNVDATGAPSRIQGHIEASYPADFVAAIVGFRIERELVLGEADRLGIEPTADHRQQARSAFYGMDPELADRVEAGWSEAYAQRLIDDIATELALTEELGQAAVEQWRSEAVVRTRIEVSSRYGRWDPERQQVVPPAGPVEPTGIDPFLGV